MSYTVRRHYLIFSNCGGVRQEVPCIRKWQSDAKSRLRPDASAYVPESRSRGNSLSVFHLYETPTNIGYAFVSFLSNWTLTTA